MIPACEHFAGSERMIAKALEPYQTFWHEDPIKMDSLSSLKRYAEVSPAPISASALRPTISPPRWARPRWC